MLTSIISGQLIILVGLIAQDVWSVGVGCGVIIASVTCLRRAPPCEPTGKTIHKQGDE